MDPIAFFSLSLVTQVSLGSGYLAYLLAYAGLREHHNSLDAIFITLAYAAVASLGFWSAASAGPWLAAMAGAGSAMTAAALWRKWLRDICQRLLSIARVHRDDGLHRAWSAIVQTDCKVGQASVHTKDGRVLYLNDRSLYSKSPWQGLYLGGDGSVVMVVEEEELPDGTTEVRQGVADDNFGVRMTYIPPDQVARVNLRMK